VTSADAAPNDGSLTRTAAILAAATLALVFVLASIDHDGPGWLLQPILGLATAVTAWRAGGRSPRNALAFAALVIGVLAILVFLGFVVGES
jgi:hypothetical protein